MNQSKVYFPNLNGLRFLAALSVMIYHFYGMSVLNGHLGVVLFFVLSGFLITYLLFVEKERTQKIDFKKFYWRRILRIWPLYFLILFLGIAFVFFDDEIANSTISNSTYYLLFIPNLAFVLGTTLPIAGILWSVGSEEQFYLVWPWLLHKFSVRNIILVFILIILFFSVVPHAIDYLNNRMYQNEKNVLYYSSRMLLRMSFNSMATGGILAFLLYFKSSSLKILFNPFLQIANALILTYCWVNNVHFFFNDQIYAIMFGLIIIYLGGYEKSPKLFENKPFNYLGKISYGLYVYHLVAIKLMQYVLGKLNWNIESAILQFSSMCILTVILSTISYELIEMPFLRIKRKSYTIIHSGRKE